MDFQGPNFHLISVSMHVLHVSFTEGPLQGDQRTKPRGAGRRVIDAEGSTEGPLQGGQVTNKQRGEKAGAPVVSFLCQPGPAP